jgi:hypothetical protein
VDPPIDQSGSASLSTFHFPLSTFHFPLSTFHFPLCFTFFILLLLVVKEALLVEMKYKIDELPNRSL